MNPINGAAFTNQVVVAISEKCSGMVNGGVSDNGRKTALSSINGVRSHYKF
jgi:hypothetical protein